MDVLLTLAALLPSPEFGGSLTANTREAYQRIRWEDERPKPAWTDLLARWPEVEAEIARVEASAKLDVSRVLETLVIKTNAAGDLDPQDRAAFDALRAGRGAAPL